MPFLSLTHRIIKAIAFADVSPFVSLISKQAQSTHNSNCLYSYHVTIHFARSLLSPARFDTFIASGNSCFIPTLHRTNNCFIAFVGRYSPSLVDQTLRIQNMGKRNYPKVYEPITYVSFATLTYCLLVVRLLTYWLTKHIYTLITYGDNQSQG